MGIINDVAQWDANVYEIEKDDLVIGGPDGITNRPIVNLANRTQYLKRQLDVISSDKSVVLFAQTVANDTDFENAKSNQTYSIFRTDVKIGYKYDNPTATWVVNSAFRSGVLVFSVNERNIFLLDNEMNLFNLVNI